MASRTNHANRQSEQDRDARLGELLSILKQEPEPEANFEERFLYNFKDKLAQELVRKPARSLLWEHIATFLGHRRAVAYSTASTAGALALAIVAWPGSADNRTAEHDFLAQGEDAFSQLAAEHDFNPALTSRFAKRTGKHHFAFASYDDNGSTSIALTNPEDADNTLPNLVSDRATLVPFEAGSRQGAATSYSGYGAF